MPNTIAKDSHPRFGKFLGIVPLNLLHPPESDKDIAVGIVRPRSEVYTTVKWAWDNLDVEAMSDYAHGILNMYEWLTGRSDDRPDES